VLIWRHWVILMGLVVQQTRKGVGSGTRLLSIQRLVVHSLLLVWPSAHLLALPTAIRLQGMLALGCIELEWST